eukprot:364301-Chlamydomonas_euryale.AAC.1
MHGMHATLNAWSGGDSGCMVWRRLWMRGLEATLDAWFGCQSWIHGAQAATMAFDCKEACGAEALKLKTAHRTPLGSWVCTSCCVCGAAFCW